jgi:hypothetical protein
MRKAIRYFLSLLICALIFVLAIRAMEHFLHVEEVIWFAMAGQLMGILLYQNKMEMVNPYEKA